MNEHEVSEAVLEWVQAKLPDIATGYSFPVASKIGALPDAVVMVTEKVIDPEHPDFPFAQLQQVWMRTFPIEISIMVQVEEDEDGEAAHRQLQAFGETMETEIHADATLGDRVEMVSPRLRFDYSMPFTEYQDGTRGRSMYAYLTVGETIPAPD